MRHGADYGQQLYTTFSLQCSRERSDDYNFKVLYVSTFLVCGWSLEARGASVCIKQARVLLVFVHSVLLLF